MFVCRLKCGSEDEFLCNSSDENDDGDDYEGLISGNIETLRNEINVIIDENRYEYIYSNPTRILLKNDIEDEHENEDVDEEFVSLEKLRDSEMIKITKLNEILNTTIEREMIEFAKKEFNEQMQVVDFDWNVNNKNSFTIYRINGVVNDKTKININSKRFGIFIDEASQMFDKCLIVKPVLSDPFSDEIYLISGNKTSNSFIKNKVPINYENYIDFLYSMYAYTLYVLDLVQDIQYKTNSSKIEFINLSVCDEYKFIVDKCKKKLIALGMIQQG